MERVRALVIGNSHTTVVGEATKIHDINPIYAEIYRWGKRPDGVGLTWEETATQLRIAPDRTVLFTMLEGEDHTMISLLKPAIPFDFHFPKSGLPTNRDAVLIPYRTIETLLRQKIRNRVMHYLAAMRKVFDGPIFHLESPPPKADNDFLKSKSDPILRAFNVEEFDINDKNVRLKFWLLQRRLLNKFCDKVNITFIPCPAETVDDNQFLKREYWGKDPFHGNVKYGTAVLRQIETIMHKVNEE